MNLKRSLFLSTFFFPFFLNAMEQSTSEITKEFQEGVGNFTSLSPDDPCPEEIVTDLQKRTNEKKGEKINFAGIPTRAAFVFSAKKGYLDIVQALHSKGLRIDIYCPPVDTTALIQAASNPSNVAMVKWLIEHGAAINYMDKQDVTPLIHAASSLDNDEIIKILLDNGADVNQYNKTSESGNALMQAAITGNYDTVKLLLEKKVDMNAQDSNGQTALHGAALGANVDTVRLLIKAGADITIKNNRGLTPLFMATHNKKNPNVTQLLLEHGAAVNALSNIASSPLMEACMYNCPKIVEVLLKAGAKVNQKDNNVGWTALIAASVKQNIENVKLLLEYGADPNIKDKDGGTAIYYAVKNNDAVPSNKSDIIDLLYEKGATDDLTLVKAKIAQDRDEEHNELCANLRRIFITQEK